MNRERREVLQKLVDYMDGDPYRVELAALRAANSPFDDLDDTGKFAVELFREKIGV